MSYAEAVETFKKHIIEGGILDPKDVHHEFVSGLHGRKLDFDSIEADSPLFSEWIAVTTAALKELYSPERLQNVVLASVANGTNRVVPLVAESLGNGASYLLTEKSSPKSARLVAEAAASMPELKDRFFVVLEDVGTKGTTSASVVLALRETGAKDIEVLNTWQRREQLEELVAVDVPHHAVIKDMLPTYTPEECQAEGLCAAGAKFIEHAK